MARAQEKLKMSSSISSAFVGAFSNLVHTRAFDMERSSSGLVALCAPADAIHQLQSQLASNPACKNACYAVVHGVRDFRSVYIGTTDSSQAHDRIQRDLDDPRRPSADLAFAIGLGWAFPREAVTLVETAMVDLLAGVPDLCLLTKQRHDYGKYAHLSPVATQAVVDAVPLLTALGHRALAPVAKLRGHATCFEPRRQQGADLEPDVLHLQDGMVNATVHVYGDTAYIMPGSVVASATHARVSSGIVKARQLASESRRMVCLETGLFRVVAPIQCESLTTAAQFVTGRIVNGRVWQPLYRMALRT